MKNETIIARRDVIDKVLYVIPDFLVDHVEVHMGALRKDNECSPSPTYTITLKQLYGVRIFQVMESLIMREFGTDSFHTGIKIELTDDSVWGHRMEELQEDVVTLTERLTYLTGLVWWKRLFRIGYKGDWE